MIYVQLKEKYLHPRRSSSSADHRSRYRDPTAAEEN